MATIDYIGATIISTMVLLNTGTGLDGGYVASKEVTLAFLAGLLVLQVLIPLIFWHLPVPDVVSFVGSKASASVGEKWLSHDKEIRSSQDQERRPFETSK
jgi:hypothetical protein